MVSRVSQRHKQLRTVQYLVHQNPDLLQSTQKGTPYPIHDIIDRHAKDTPEHALALLHVLLSPVCMGRYDETDTDYLTVQLLHVDSQTGLRPLDKICYALLDSSSVRARCAACSTASTKLPSIH